MIGVVMNQILITQIENRNNNYYYKYLYNTNSFMSQKLRIKKKYFIIFLISIIICNIIIFYFLFSFFKRLNEQNQTNLLKEKYNINTLYSTNTKYTSLKLSNDISIIGLIEIPKLDISYPILSESNDDLLKISVCRFSGPLPNRIGNLCIAGHNYKNTLMFSKLNKLNIGDYIYVTDLNNTKLEYVIYNKFKVKENNLNCIENTKNIEITLITCNDTNNSERIVIKAKMKG